MIDNVICGSSKQQQHNTHMPPVSSVVVNMSIHIPAWISAQWSKIFIKQSVPDLRDFFGDRIVVTHKNPANLSSS
jgi:hypothetical protein